MSIVNTVSATGAVLPSATVAGEYARATGGTLRIGLRRETDAVFDAYPELR